MNQVTVLVSSAGRRCELIRIIRSDAASLGLKCRIVATDMAPEWSAACREADASHQVPPANHPEFIEVTQDVLQREECNLLIPTIDTELEAISRARDGWEASRPNLFVLSHSSFFVDICRDKARTMETLAKAGIAVPTTYFRPGGKPARLDDAFWPMIAKPPGGSSSKGIRLVHNEREFEEVVEEGMLLIQDRLEGREYTVNTYVTRAGQVAAVVPHRRIAVRGGEVEKGIVEDLPVITDTVKRLVSSVGGVSGPFNFQVIQGADGQCRIFEINARLGGGYPLAHRAGGRFTKWAIEEGLLGRQVEPSPVEFGWKMMRYDTSVFER
ncbi:MAG: ATP-grasp domain-containing protein [Gemmataceae bacterium]